MQEMPLDTASIARWLEPLARTPDETADLFSESRRETVLAIENGALAEVATRRERALAARWCAEGRQTLVASSGGGDAEAREAVRRLRAALGRSPLPMRPGGLDEEPEDEGSTAAPRWARRLPGLIARAAPRHRLTATIAESRREIVPARGAPASFTRRLFSLEGTIVAASRAGDEPRAFAFHAPESEQITEELKRALSAAAEPRERPIPCGDGEIDVVLAEGCAVVFLHEALAHPLEAGAVSPLSALADARVAVSELEVKDDPTRLDLFGGYEQDDEGSTPRAVRLLDGGRVAGRLTDRAHAGPRSSGHGRRGGAFDAPAPRGSNLVVAPGHASAEEIARRLDHGLWIEQLTAASVELSSGQFRLRFPRARRVRRGRLADECGPGLLAGEILPALAAIEAGVGREVRPCRGLGWCARDGVVVPVGGAAPDLLLRRLRVRSLA
jgi:predicted Zn-dependent protease